jgi:multidrug efflux pump
MTLPELCIKRPVFATVLSLVVLLVGLVCYQRLAVREYPKIDEPIVNVTTNYKGASAEVIESQITKPLEDSLSGIEGVDILSSSSRAEVSQINVRFLLKRDPDAAAAEVRDKVARVRNRLPEAADEPVIAKTEADAFPIMWVAVSGTAQTPLEISDYINRYIKPRMSVLPGVADVRYFGERKTSMRIWLDRAKLAGYRLTVQDVEDAIRRQNVEVPAGRIESRAREFSVTSQTDLQTPAQFGDIVVASVSGYPVRLRDVARAEYGPLDERVMTRFNGVPAGNLGIIRQSVANPLEISQSVRKEIEFVRQTLPQGMSIELAYDTSVFIEQSINAVFTTIGEAILLVAIVIFFFLRNLRATIIPLVTIPVSLVGAFALMYLFGFTINTLTLLAMVLAIGLVVDDAIVVLENIHRRLEEGMPRIRAAMEGSREIAFAVIAMTLTLAAVYAPLAFATGRTGRLFIEFALALAGAVLVSGFVALTLSPMMCSVLLRHERRHTAVYNAIERMFRAMTNGYVRTLAAVLDNRPVVIVVYALVLAGTVWLGFNLRQELSPLEDRGVIFGVVVGPEGATPAYTSENLARIEGFYRQVPEAARFNATAGWPTVNQGVAILRLKDWNEREKSQQQIAQELFPKFRSLPGVLAFPNNPPSFGQSPRSKPLEFVLMTQAPYEELQRMVDRMISEASKNPGLLNVDTDLRLNKPELKVTMNRDKLADLGIPVETVGRTLETMLGGRQVTRFKRDGEQYDVIVQILAPDRTRPDDISEIYVRGRGGEMVQLSNVVSVRETVAPRSLNHFNRLRSATVDATLAPGYTLGEAIAFMQETARKVLPSTVQNDLAGQSREFRDSSADIVFVFAFALLFIYLVLAAQFESFVDPFIIMLTVPLATGGALGLLMLASMGALKPIGILDGTLNVYTKIGLITLVGLITKHGILIVEFANQLQDRGRTKRQAVVEAAMLRLRPILMTTGAMVLGAIPLALASGAGAESRQQIGMVIVGGLLVGTLLTLYVIPVAYSLLATVRRKIEEETLPDAARDGAHAAHGSHGVAREAQGAHAPGPAD